MSFYVHYMQLYMTNNMSFSQCNVKLTLLHQSYKQIYLQVFCNWGLKCHFLITCNKIIIYKVYNYSKGNPFFTHM